MDIDPEILRQTDLKLEAIYKSQENILINMRRVLFPENVIDFDLTFVVEYDHLDLKSDKVRCAEFVSGIENILENYHFAPMHNHEKGLKDELGVLCFMEFDYARRDELPELADKAYHDLLDFAYEQAPHK